MSLKSNGLELSIIIVNYNVKCFLEQCLCSVKKAIASLGAREVEVFVVDNDSSDGSANYLEPKFPWVQFLLNKENLGFAKANNQAFFKSKGDYILFLNPDTILAEDCLEKTLSNMDSLPDAGACGVRMVDGKGGYLRESKRGFPSPWVSFCKLSGLAAIFPRSPFFAKYYLGHLGEKEINQVDTLSGAFMMVRKNVLDKTGGFDETFYMYGEDIDLSYRIRLAGYHNYYFPLSTLIHFKGESTRKDFRYVKFFYKAMSRFSNKYFRSGGRAFFGVLLEAAIWTRAGIATLLQPFTPKRENSLPAADNIFLLGDKKEVDSLKHFLLSQRKIMVETREKAEEIIFCEGEGFSFAEAIEQLQQLPRTLRFRFHAAGSNCIIGSDSKNRKGKVMIFSDFNS